MDFRILGPLEVLDDGRQVALGGSKQRALMGVLLLHAGETLSTDRLIEELWGEHPPATAAKTVQVHISRLRKALGGDGVVVTREHGYQLELDPDQLDANRFERLVAEARTELAANNPERAAAVLEEALALWRGRPLADLAYEPFAQREIARLDDLRVAAQELLIEAKLALGGHSDVVGQLEALIAEHPYRERLRALLMLALYRSDRQADALQAYQDARRKLVEELGIEPGERLRELERAILAQDPALALPVTRPVEEPRPTPAPAEIPHGRSARRLVSILFADLVGSTGLAERLDPEAMHALLDRYTELCSEAIERHGGTVEGFIGDAVVGVFGLAELHEDDALRAVRVAVELREAAARLSAELERERGVGLAIKFGIESGEVFLGTGARRSPFAAGDAFNVAARLEGIAEAGEILLGENIHPLVGHAVRAERLEPLALKGRTARVQAWRLLELNEEQPPRQPSGTRFVGREGELAQLQSAFARACEQETLHAVAIVGPAGIGKSRLVHELVAELGERATPLVGRCLAYGEGTTYQPLAEIVGQLAGVDPHGQVAALLDGDERATELILGAIGLAERAARAEETFWAVRTLLERLARERPVLVVIEDVHWAEPTLLDMLEYLVAFSSGHRILFVCLARPEFLEQRPVWATPRPNCSFLALDPLPEAQARELVESAGGDELASATAARIVATAEGNPLFLEQLVAVGAESGDAGLPATIQAVIAARIDRLEPGERVALEDASVQGRSFYVGALAEQLPETERAALASRLVSLAQQQLISAERSDVAGEDAFRFAHALIREAAYQAVPKQRRAVMHEVMARWLERHAGVQDETVGHHLAEAYRHRAELGPVGESGRALATEAAGRLAAAADGALLRGDTAAAAQLLERAESLLEPDSAARAALLPRLGAALLEAGRLADAERVLTEAIDRGQDDPRLAARAQVERQLVRLQAGSAGSTEESAEIAPSALAVLEAHGDELGQCRALCLLARHALIEGRSAEADDAWRRAAEHATRVGDQPTLFEILDWRASAALFGPTPVPQAIRRCRQIAEQVHDSPVAVARTLRPLAALHAMAGDFDEAEGLLRSADEILRELGGLESAIAQQEALAELLTGRTAAAEARLRASCERLEAMGEKALLATTAAMLAQVLYGQDRYEEAAELCRVSEEAAADADLSAQVSWRTVRAKLLAAEGRAGEGRPLAEEAVRLAERTDFLTLQAEALADLGLVLAQAGRSDDAEAALRGALELYGQKGDVTSAGRVKTQLRVEVQHGQVHDDDAA